MNTISTTEARAHLSDIINQVCFGKMRIQLERQGKPLAAIIPLEDLKLLEDLEDKLDILEAEKAKKEIPRKGTKSLRKLIQELKL